jgi:hypothetical protein
VKLVAAGVGAKDLFRYRYVDQSSDHFRSGSAAAPVALGNPFSPMTPVEAVIAGLYDAAVVSEKRFREVAAEHDLVSLVRFEDSSKILVNRGGLADSATEQLRDALLSLNAASGENAFADGSVSFKIATEDDFVEMRQQLSAEMEFGR